MSEELTETPITINEVALAQDIAKALKESNVMLIGKIINVIGPERTQAFLGEALELEANGGLLRKDGQRRTPGGTFFYHVRGKLPPVERRQLWGYAVKKKTTPSSRHKKPKDDTPTVPPLTWDQVQALFQEVKTEASEAKTVKLTLIGRPGRVIQQPNCVVVSMKGKEPPSLPKGLPTPPPNSAVTWAVFIANKQWNAVQESITKNTDDQLIVEGYPLIDPKSGANVVLVTSCKSVLQDRAAREAKQSKG
jgi:hypothetical protein